MIENDAQWAGSVGADRVSSETGIVGVKLARVSLQAPLGPTNPRQHLSAVLSTTRGKTMIIITSIHCNGVQYLILRPPS